MKQLFPGHSVEEYRINWSEALKLEVPLSAYCEATAFLKTYGGEGAFSIGSLIDGGSRADDFVIFYFTHEKDRFMCQVAAGGRVVE